MISTSPYTERIVRAKVRKDIETFGWSVLTSVHKDRAYSHTLGLQESFGHAEIEIYGLSDQLNTAFLNLIASRIKGGDSFEAGESLDWMVDGFDIMLVANPADPAGPAMSNGRLRLVWPDSRHRFPWHEDCDPDCGSQRLMPDSTLKPA